MSDKPLDYADVFRSSVSYAKRIYEIVERVKSYDPNADLERINRAYVFAAQAHDLQKRKSGELFITHPLAVAGLLAQMKLDADSVITGLLHDTVEDTDVSLNDIVEHFGADVAYLVDGVTKLSFMDELTPRHIKEAENMRKLVLAMGNDLRVVFVKLADRLHNMSTLGSMPADRAAVKAEECINFYAPLANRLGIYWLKQALQDLAFFTLNRERYRELAALRDASIANLPNTPDELAQLMRETLVNDGIQAEVYWRTKHIFSLHNKLEEKAMSFEELRDALAFRIIVGSRPDCYHALGILHELYRHQPHTFKDYISSPKINGYSSLHTTVFIDGGQRLEVQIRTRDMHQYAENGLAAHWLYKDGSVATYGDLSWLKKLADYSTETTNPLEFMENVQLDLFIQEVLVFSRDGDLFSLPRNATPLDFAYAVHTSVGNHCVAVRINNENAELNQHLHNGDRIEVITNPEQSPSLSWLNLVRTPRARHAIRQFFRKQDRQDSIALGERILHDVAEAEVPPSILRQLACDTLEMLKERLGRGELSLDQLFRALHGNQQSWSLAGVGKHMIYAAHCCYPVPGDSILGRLVKGRGFELHASRCQRVMSNNAHDWRPFSWEPDEGCVYPTAIYLKTENLRGMLSRVSSIISSLSTNIEDMRMDQQAGGITHLYFLIEVHGRDDLAKILRKLKSLQGVINVQRTRSNELVSDNALKPLPQVIAEMKPAES